MVMSQRSRPAYLDDGVDGDGDVLNRSWDVESRYRLQESALNLPREKTAALFRVQVELGLHELTAAMSSLSRRIDKLEENTAPPEKEQQDQAVKELARSARCISQALPGIASGRTRRRALHGYFRESDEQRSNCGDRIDPATRALVVEGLASLAGKVRVNTGLGDKDDGGGLGSRSGENSSSRGLSPSSPGRRKSRTRPKKEKGGKVWERVEKGLAEVMASKYFRDIGGHGHPRGLGSVSGTSFPSQEKSTPPRGYAPEGGFASERLQVEHLDGPGPSLPQSPIAMAGSACGEAFPCASVPIWAGDGSSRKTKRERRRAGCAELGEPGGRHGQRHRQPSASESTSSKTASQHDSSSVAPDVNQPGGQPRAAAICHAASGSATTGFGGATAEAASAGGRVLKDAGGVVQGNEENTAGAGHFESVVECSGRPNDSGERITVRASTRARGAVGKTAVFAGSRNSNDNNSSSNNIGNNNHNKPVGGSDTEADPDLIARVLLNAARVAVETEERAGGPGSHEERQGLAGSRAYDGDGGGCGGSTPRVEGNKDSRAEIEAVRALSSHVRSRASLVSSSSSSPPSSCPAAAAGAAVRAKTVAAAGADAKGAEGDDKVAGGTKTGGMEASLSGSFGTARPRRSSLGAGGGRQRLTDGAQRLSLGLGGGGPVVDAQGFLDLGAASAEEKSLAVHTDVQEKRPKRSEPNRSDSSGSDPRVAELEEKLEEIRRIGERLKQEKEAALTAEPSVTIPDQDLTDLDFFLHHARSWNNNTLDSPHASSSLRHQQLDPVLRSGRAARGAASHSAFTSAESSPRRTAEDLSSAAEAPPNPDHHAAAEPALSRLLAPPFNNAELRGDFITSLERHLAEYEDRGNAEIEADEPDDNGACCAKDGRDKGVQGDRGKRESDGKGDGQRARHDCGGGDDRAKTRDADGNDNSDGVDSSSTPQTTHTVKEMPLGPRAGNQPGSRRAVETALINTNQPASTNVGEVETHNVEVEGAPVGALRGEVRDRETDGKKKAVLQETPNGSSKGGGGSSSTWAQEYHDYLCSKDP